MKVLVTGGTGFVGSHTVRALVESGHQVRLLARRPEQVPVSLEPHGVTVDDVVAGDVTDQHCVTTALNGCEAVVHAAAVYSLDPRHRDEVLRTNELAAELMLGTAAAQGLDPVVHVSSTVALARFGGSNPGLPLGDLDGPYARSKLRSEVTARRLQDQGHPVVTVYPGGVFGPHDPYLGDQGTRLRWVVLGRFPLWPRGGFHVVDVRDVATVIARVLEPGHGARRFVVPGHHMDAELLYRSVESAIGRRRPALCPPDWLLGPGTTMIGLANRYAPRSMYYPGDRDGFELSRRDTRLDDTPARDDLGVTPIAFEQSIRDTVAWMVDAGHLPERYRPR